MQKSRSSFQLIWGIALVLAGVGVFFRTPQVLSEIAGLAHFSGTIWIIRICFYIIAVVLIGGGLRKIVQHVKNGGANSRNTHSPAERKESKTDNVDQ